MAKRRGWQDRGRRPCTPPPLHVREWWLQQITYRGRRPCTATAGTVPAHPRSQSDARGVRQRIQGARLACTVQSRASQASISPSRAPLQQESPADGHVPPPLCAASRVEVCAPARPRRPARGRRESRGVHMGRRADVVEGTPGPLASRRHGPRRADARGRWPAMHALSPPVPAQHQQAQARQPPHRSCAAAAGRPVMRPALRQMRRCPVPDSGPLRPACVSRILVLRAVPASAEREFLRGIIAAMPGPRQGADGALCTWACCAHRRLFGRRVPVAVPSHGGL